MEQKQFKIYSFGRDCISEGAIIASNINNQVITLSESFLILALECYKNEKFLDGQLLTEFIKVLLPNSEEAAKSEWEKGLTFNNDRYYAWFATTGGMKKEDVGGKCETIFIHEDYRVFADEFEHLISLGKFKEIEESKEKICINKDILSRLSLGTSSVYHAGDMPNIIVLRQPTFRIKKDYKTVEKYTTGVDGKPRIDYKLVDHYFNGDIDVFDGGAVATPNVFIGIQKSLKLDYSVEFAIIRGYGIGIKGMITKFDIIGYLDDTYIADTEYCRKVDGSYQLKDMWNEWQTVTVNTMLLNESMVKLAKYYKTDNGENWSTFQERLSKVDPKYRGIIGRLYITKVNKRDEDIEDYRRTSYQLINALALSKADYYELLKDEVKFYKKILSPFNKDSDKDEWIINLDAIRLFFKNIINGNHEDETEYEEEVKRIGQNVATKCEELLHISEDFIKLRYVRTTLARLIEKRCRELASGKFTVKAKYQYIAVCPLSYVNWAMYRNQGENGLQAGQFHSADCNDGDVRTIARNPLCAYSEVHNVRFIRNAKLDKWLSPCRELVYFNQQSDILALMSSADADGDACTVADSEIIKNAVVVPKDGKYFINTDDGHKEEMEYTPANRFLATYKASGNLIGKISLKAASINSNSQQTPDYYDTLNHKFVFWHEINDSKDKKEVVKGKLDSGEWLYTKNASDQHRNHIRDRFYANEKDIYTVLFNAMVSIDAPKTLYFPSSADMEVLNGKYGRKAYFLQFRENKEDVVSNQYEYTCGLLDQFTGEIKKHLLNEIENRQTEFKNRADLIQGKLVNGDYNVDDYDKCLKAVGELYEKYTEARQQAKQTYRTQRKKEDRVREIEQNDGSWGQFKDDEYDAKIKSLKREQNKNYKEIDAKYIVLADGLLSKYDLVTVSNAIGNLKNCTEHFIINLFYPVFEYLNLKLQSGRYGYKKDAEGDISYLSERYLKVAIGAVDNSNIVRTHHLEEKKRLKAIQVKADIRARVLDQTVISLIKAELKNQGYIKFDIKLKDGNVLLSRDNKDMLQVFEDWLQIQQYNLLMCSGVKAELLIDVAKNMKSLKLTVTEINV